MTNQELQAAIDSSTRVLRESFGHCPEYKVHQQHLTEMLKIQCERALKSAVARKSTKSKGDQSS
jgi:hypothetical protein